MDLFVEEAWDAARRAWANETNRLQNEYEKQKADLPRGERFEHVMIILRRTLMPAGLATLRSRAQWRSAARKAAAQLADDTSEEPEYQRLVLEFRALLEAALHRRAAEASSREPAPRKRD